MDLFGRRRFSIKPGLERVQALLQRLGNPEQSFSCIHVAGTNGKGSTSAFISSITSQSGIKTGLFTSPHLISYRERFRINGSEISQKHLDQLTEKILNAAVPEDTFFELTTALAALYFAENGVELAVMEAGMGGGKDATAALSGILTVLTPVSLDHCQWLGNGIEEIAAEKIAIAKPGTTVVTAEQLPEAKSVIEKFCREQGSRLRLSAIREMDTRLGIPGSYQLQNASLALDTVEELSTLGYSSSKEQQKAGLAKANWPGRMELLRHESGAEVLLDGAHNPAGAEALSQAVKELYPEREIILVTGMMGDKDLAETVSRLAGMSKLIITTKPDQERAVEPENLAENYRQLGKTAFVGGSVKEGLEKAFAITEHDQLILVAGSLFAVGEARAVLTGLIPDSVRG